MIRIKKMSMASSCSILLNEMIIMTTRIEKIFKWAFYYSLPSYGSHFTLITAMASTGSDNNRKWHQTAVIIVCSNVAMGDKLFLHLMWQQNEPPLSLSRVNVKKGRQMKMLRKLKLMQQTIRENHVYIKIIKRSFT